MKTRLHSNDPARILTHASLYLWKSWRHYPLTSWEDAESILRQAYDAVEAEDRLSSYALWTTASPKGDPLTVLEIFSFICLLAIAFLLVFFSGFHRALHEKPTYRMTILRETSLDFHRNPPKVPPGRNNTAAAAVSIPSAKSTLKSISRT